MTVQVRRDCKNLSEFLGRWIVNDKFKHQQYCPGRPKRKGLRGTSGASAPVGHGVMRPFWHRQSPSPLRRKPLQELVRIQQN